MDVGDKFRQVFIHKDQVVEKGKQQQKINKVSDFQNHCGNHSFAVNHQGLDKNGRQNKNQ